MIGHTTAVLRSLISFTNRIYLQHTGLFSLRIVNIVTIQVSIRYEHQEKLMFHLWLSQHLKNKTDLLEIGMDF